MQALFRHRVYLERIMSAQQVSRLRALRQAAGLSMRELARQIGEDHSNVRFWESTGKTPRSDVLAPMAQALGVSVEELLGEEAQRKSAAPASGGRARQLFEALSKLPRRQQEKILDIIEPFVRQHSSSVNSDQAA